MKPNHIYSGWVWACWEFDMRRLSRNTDTIHRYMESLG